jgi:hypothetical protein
MVAFGNFSTSGMAMALISYAMFVLLWLTYLARRNRLSPLVEVPSAVRLALVSPCRDPHDVHRDPNQS